MPLLDETITLAEGMADLEAEIDDQQAQLDDLDDPHSDRAEAHRTAIAQYRRFKQGIELAAAANDLDGDTEVTVGPPSMAEECLYERIADDDASPPERAAGFVAAATVDAPWAGGSIEETYQTLIGNYPRPFVEWLETRINALAPSGNVDTRSSSTGPASATTSNSPSDSTATDSS